MHFEYIFQNACDSSIYVRFVFISFILLKMYVKSLIIRTNNNLTMKTLSRPYDNTFSPFL